VLASRLGRRFLLRLLLVGLLPLALVALPLYYQTRTMLRDEARATMNGFARLAKSQLVVTLDRARTVVEQASRDDRRGTLPLPPFRAQWRLGADLRATAGETLPWPALSGGNSALLARGRTILTEPYRVAEGTTVAMVTPSPGGGYYAAEIDPLELWQVTQAGNFGDDDVLLILDSSGRLLAASHEAVTPGSTILPVLPAQSQAVGDSELAGLGRVHWSYSELWLKGTLGAERWGVLLARSAAAQARVPWALLQMLVVVVVVVFCAIILLSFHAARSLLLPIEALARVAGQISDGEWHRRAPVTGDDELGALVQSFNRMTARLTKSYEERIRLGREAAVGRLAENVAHHINNPLAIMQLTLELAEDGKPDCRQLLADMHTQVQRITKAVRTVTTFAQQRHGAGDNAPAAEVIGNLCALQLASFIAADVQLELAVTEGDYQAACTGADLQELAIHLLNNARESCIEARRLGQQRDFRVQLALTPEAGDLVLTVTDNGEGFGEHLAAAFEPFYTTRVQGFGLGLAICRRICDQHGGSIRAESPAGGGACVTVRLPRLQPQ